MVKEVCCEEMKKNLNNSCIWGLDDIGRYFISWDRFRTSWQGYEFFQAIIKFCPFCGERL